MKAPLVLLPGMMCDARLFGPQVHAFSYERAVMAIPIAGHNSVAQLAADVLKVAPDRFALAGLSMGGIVAMEVIHQAPQRVTRLALLDTNPKAESDTVAQSREPLIARVQNGELRDVVRDEMKPNYLASGPQADAILDLCMTMAEKLGPDVFVRQSRALQSRPDQQDTLRNIAVPALVLCGKDDKLCPVHRHELMRDLIPHATLKIIDNAGHLPTLEKPGPTNEALLEWLNQ